MICLHFVQAQWAKCRQRPDSTLSAARHTWCVAIRNVMKRSNKLENGEEENRSSVVLEVVLLATDPR